MEKPAPLEPAELEVALQRLPGWTVEGTRLAKEFEFKDFVDSLSFVTRLLPHFEQRDHHPDVHVFYNRVKFELSRYDLGGKITDRDVEIAKLIEQGYARAR
ncbi:MAG TPA: 4a-hydroxytetrahydrobiopterin dehydratase [Vicinamibacterales bacterium]|nr:4a-hydroxytetrahydrobiopterin dehydratase [Vicinamibacterales bacterium]